MPISEIIVTAIAEAIFGYLINEYGGTLENWIRTRTGRNPKQKAFKRALGIALAQLEQQEAEWVPTLFDASFFEHEGAPILAQFLLRDGHPDPSELAAQWANSLNIHRPEQRAYYTRELEPIAAEFLSTLAQQLKMQEELRELNDSRAFEQLVQDVQALRKQFDADKATPGTRRDYLRWLINRNLYIDPRGTFQPQSQVPVKLEEVYISLKAQQDDYSSQLKELLLALQDWKPAVELTTDWERVIENLVKPTNLSSREIFLRGLWSASIPQTARLHLYVNPNPIPDLTLTYKGTNKLLSLLFKCPPTRLPLTFTPGAALELSEAVRRHQQLVILGDPGSGKTTLLHYLALKHAQALYEGRVEASSSPGKARFPILVRIAEYAESSVWRGQAFSDFLVENPVIHQCPRRGLRDLLLTELEKGGCLVLLDGLDEIVSGDDRRGVVQRIEDFVQGYATQGNCFVITSRIAGYKSAPLGAFFARYTVQDMDSTQIRLFLQRWCQAVEDSQMPELPLQQRQHIARGEVDAIMYAVQHIPGVSRLAVNPLLLRTLALIHRTGAQFPQQRIKLYELAAETLAITWRRAQGVPQSALVDEHYLTRLLGKLAYWMHANKPTGLATEQEVYRELGQEWARIKGLSWEEDNPDIEREVENFLIAVQEHTGIFVERAPRKYGFMHLTFEEYYAARHLVARASSRARLLYQHRHDPRWEEPLLLALGFVGLYHPEDAEELVETVVLAQGDVAAAEEFVPSRYEDLLGRDYLFALRCLVDDIPVNSQVLRALTRRCIDELLQHTGPARFERYQQALRERLSTLINSKGDSLLEALLIDGAGDTDASVQVRAVECIGACGKQTPEFVRLLINALHDNEIAVRCAAMRSLTRLDVESREVVDALRLMLSDSNLRIRYEAARSLWNLRQWDLAKTIIETLLDAEQTYLRDDEKQKDPELVMSLAATWDFLNLASDKAIAALVDLLNDTDANLRQQAAALLRNLNIADTPGTVITALQQALTDESDLVRLQAAESLAHFEHGSDAVVEVLLDAFNKDPSRQFEIIGAFGYLENPPSEVVTALLATVRDRHTLQTNDPFADHLVGQVCLLLSSLDYSANENPSLAEIITTFTEVLHDDYAYFCTVAAESLGRLSQRYPEARAILLSALHNNNPTLRCYASHGLAMLGAEHASDEVVKALQLALRDTESSVRYQAALSLGQLKHPSNEMMTTLLEALRQTSGWSYVLVPQFVGEFGTADEQTLETLVQKLREDQTGVASAYVQALIQLGRRFPSSVNSITQKLAQILEDPKYAGNNYVYEGLWQLIVSGESWKE